MITTTLPVGLVRDLEAALGRPGAGVLQIVLRHDGAPPTIVDRRRRFGIATGPDVGPPCPACSTAMTVPAEGRGDLVCPGCGLRRSVRDYRRLLRLVTHFDHETPCPS